MSLPGLFEDTKRKADAGDPREQSYLAAMYFDGVVVAKDPAEYLRWSLAAASQGYALAQHKLAASYASGRFISKNIEESYYWYSRAALQDFPGIHRSSAELRDEVAAELSPEQIERLSRRLKADLGA